MDRFYSALKQLPTELLLLSASGSSIKLSELKMSRWLTRDTFLEMSQSPFAASNGIGPDHLNNLLNLQDLLLIEALIKTRLTTDDSTENNFVLAFIQLILLETPNLIEFLVSSQFLKSLDDYTIDLLIDSCPAFKSCVNFIAVLDSEISLQDLIYYWNLVACLASKYPSSQTSALCTQICNEFATDPKTRLKDLDLTSSRRILNILQRIALVFPNLIDSIRDPISIWASGKPFFNKEIKMYSESVRNAKAQSIKEPIYYNSIALNKVKSISY